MRGIITSKRGQVNTMAPAILSLVVAAIILVMGLIIMGGIDDARTDDVSVTVSNETGAYINATGYTLTYASECGFNNVAITSAINTTSNTTILSVNYSVSSVGVVTNASTANFDAVWISYTYDWGDEACLASNETIHGLGTFGDFWTIIVLGFVAMIVIGLLLNAFGRRKR